MKLATLPNRLKELDDYSALALATDDASPRDDLSQPPSAPGWRVRASKWQKQHGIHVNGRRVALIESDDGAPKIDDIRNQVCSLLQRKKANQAAALLQKIAQEWGGHEVAALAVQIGDRCHALGLVWAATNCYLAASRADPLYEYPLIQLTEACQLLDDNEAAVAHLQRIIKLMRARGAHEESIPLYRRMVNLLPYRDDLREGLLLAMTSGG